MRDVGAPEGGLDAATLLAASRAISSELVPDRLREKVLSALMEIACAERGAFVIERDGQLVLSARGGLESAGAAGGGIVSAGDALPVTLLRCVVESGEGIVLEDGAEGRFRDDPHFLTSKPRSALCWPIGPRSSSGLVYLENSAAKGVFSKERVSAVSALCAQAAVSLENAKSYEELSQKAEKAAAELRTKGEELAGALSSLQKTRKQLLVQEKLASLGQLAAGVAHEIRNPLNFIMNFSELSLEILDELNEDLTEASRKPSPAVFERLQGTIGTLGDNLRKVTEHGQRANRIVHGMLMHAQAASDEPEPANLHEILSQSARLAYHGLRAKHSDFQVQITEDFDTSIGLVDLLPPDMGRVFLNIISNACYAIRQKQRASGRDFKGQINIVTRLDGDSVVIRIRDNGPGIADDVADKIFQPFFTTKPTNEGTGLGLSISHDIVTQKHNGELTVSSVAGQYAEFGIRIPLRAPSAARAARPPRSSS